MSAVSESRLGFSQSPAPRTVASRFPQEHDNVSGLHVLIVDSDPAIQKACRELSSSLRLSVRAVETLAAAQSILLARPIDLLLLDINLQDAHGIQQFEGLRASHPEMTIVVATASATVDAAVQALRMGAADFLTTPLAIEELTSVLERAARRKLNEAQARSLHGKLSDSHHWNALLGHSPAMEKIRRIVSKVAFSNHPVLIVGESGTGKELVARTIHNHGPHASHPFVPICCSSLSAETMGRELFGFAKGAFPEARQSRSGLLVEADSGTVLFDGVNALSLEIQAKLVRVLQERAVRPIGARDPIPVHARILASADQDLARMQAAGTFRRDLYFRLNVVNIQVPPLTERREDIALLAEHILRRIRQEAQIPYELTSEASAMLQAYAWPGNVRELEGSLERACVMASSQFLTVRDFSSQLQQDSFAETIFADGQSITHPKSLKMMSIAELEKEAIVNTIRQLGGDKLKAARLLGIGKTTLYRKLKEYGLDVPNSAIPASDAFENA